MSYLLRRTAITALFVLLGFTVPAFARTVKIAWNANTESDLAGYIVRYGTSSRSYTAAVDVGKRTNFALNLDEFTTYYVAVEAYNAAGTRSTLSSEVVISADYSTCNFSLNSGNAAIGGAASNLTVALTAQSACPWNAASYSSWIKVAGRTATKGAGTVSLTIAANTTGMSRVGTIAIGGRSMLITQTSASCSASPVASNFGTFLKDGGSGSIAVNASGTQCTWGVSSDAPWLTFAGAPSRTGAGSVAFTVAANAGGAREGHLTIAGTAITIQQRARKRLEALDFDGIGADAFNYNTSTGDWTRYQWNGAFASKQTGVSTPGMTVLAADFNGDDRSDLFAYDTRTGVWARSISAPDGTILFTESVWQPGSVPTIADFNGDGRSDVLFYNPRSGAWVQWITDATTLQFTQRTGQFEAGWTVFRARFDANTRDDLFLYNANPKASDQNAGKWAQAITQSDLSFTVKDGTVVWAAGATILPVDFTRDGLSEIFALSATGTWTVASFPASGVSYTSGRWTPGWQVFRSEFNGDGVPDLLLFRPSTGEYRLALRNGASFTVVSGTWSKNAVADVTDLNGDGLTDVVLYVPSLGQWGSATSTAKPGAFMYGGGTFAKKRTLVVQHQITP
jgi:hypothetical protein